MKKEKSCGAVVYKKIDGGILYLIEKMNLGHTSLPKGHVEGNEREEETALREIKEETSLDVLLDTGFRHVITYSPSPDIIKDVVFFVAECKEETKPMDRHDDEVKESLWLPYKEAEESLTYDSDKKTLSLAAEYLKKKWKIQ